jgi:adenylate kinase family enzyme
MQSLEKVTSQMDVKAMLAAGKLNRNNRLKKIPQVKEKFDQLESKLFKDRLNRIIEPQDKIDLDKKLAKFSDFQMTQEQTRLMEIERERDMAKRRQFERRDTELDKMRRVINFNKNWNLEGEDNWKMNMERKHERDKEEERFRIRQLKKTQDRSTNKKEAMQTEVFGELDRFEKLHLEEKETDIETSQGDHMEGPGSTQELGFSGLGPNLSMKRNVDHTGHYDDLAKLIQAREKEMHSEYFRKERDKRRRKMIVDQSKGQKEIEIKRKEGGLLEKMIQESRQEEEIRYEFWRTRKAKDLIVNNRDLRENMYQNRENYIGLREEQREITILDHMIKDFNFQVDLYLKREKTLRINKDIEKRDTNYSKCRKVVEILLNIADSCYEHNQDADNRIAEDIEPKYWKENLSLLKSNKNPFQYRNPRNKISTDIFSEKFDEDETYQRYLDIELSQYLKGDGQWKLKKILTPKSHEQPIDLKLDPLGEAGRVKIPSEPVNNEYLGNLISKLIDQKYPAPKPEPLPDYPAYLPIKLCLIGKFYSGKSTVTRYLQNKFNLEIISVEDIINEGIVRFGNCDDSFDNKEEIEQHNFIQNGYQRLMNQGLEDIAEKGADETDIGENRSIDLIDDAGHQHNMRIGNSSVGANLSAIPGGHPKFEENEEVPGAEEDQLAKSEVEGENQDSDKLGHNPVKSLIRKLFRGEEPSDELYSKIIVEEIKRRHGYMTEEKYFQKLKQQREHRIQEEKDRLIKEQEQTNEKVTITRQKVDMSEKRKQIQIDESQFALVPPSGFILLDYPNSDSQAKTLERLMTNFLPRNKIPKTEAEIEKEYLLSLVKPTPKELPAKQLKPSGFDQMLYMEAANSACLNRAFGDYATPRGMHYHLIANPPPTSQTPLVETLAFNENLHKNQYLMADLNKNRSLDLPGVIDLYRQFGVAAADRQTVRIVDANLDMTSLLADIDASVAELLAQKNAYYAEFDRSIALREEARIKAETEAAERANEEARMKLVDGGELGLVLSGAKDAISKDPLKPEVLNNLLELWHKSSRTYTGQVSESFRDIRECRELVSVVIAEYQRSFIQYMETDDEKKQWLYEYQQMYNAFIDENPDMLEQEAVKEEFHQR